MSLFDRFNAWFAQHPVAGEFAIGGLILAAGVAGYFIFRKLVIVLIRKGAERTRTSFDNHLLESRVFNRFSWIIPVLLLDAFSFLMPASGEIISRLMQIAMVAIVVWTLSAIVTAVNRWYETLEVSRERPIKGYLQIINLIIYLFGAIIIIGLILDRPPWALLSGIGAMTAILLLVFRDTILSFVAGIQITSYNLLHVGDWIEMPEYGVDGDGNGRVDLIRSKADALASTANFLRGHGWRPGGGYKPGQANFRALQGWNAAGVYQQAIAIIGVQIDGS